MPFLRERGEERVILGELAILEHAGLYLPVIFCAEEASSENTKVQSDQICRFLWM